MPHVAVLSSIKILQKYTQIYFEVIMKNSPYNYGLPLDFTLLAHFRLYSDCIRSRL